MDERWTCRRCYAANASADTHCTECGTSRFVNGTVALPQPTEGGPSSGTPSPAGWRTVDGATQQTSGQWQTTGAPPPWAQPEPQRSPWLGLLRYAWILIPVAFAGFYFFTQARRDDSGAISQTGTVAVGELRVGDCFNGSNTGEISEVEGRPCSGAHEFEIYGNVIHPDGDGSYPGEDAVSAYAEPECLRQFESFVGEEYETSALYASSLSPTSESWSMGDRETLCIIYEPGNSALVGSLRNANR